MPKMRGPKIQEWVEHLRKEGPRGGCRANVIYLNKDKEKSYRVEGLCGQRPEEEEDGAIPRILELDQGRV